MLVVFGWIGCSSDPPPPPPPPPPDFDVALYGLWEDADNDCQDARTEVLIAKSWGGVTLSNDGCRVIEGVWFDPFTSETFHDPRVLDVDHFVPIAEVHRSGADRWPASKRREYGNDLKHPDTLVVVSQTTKAKRAGKEPMDWLPPNPAVQCEYIETWKKVKDTWELEMDPGEKAFVTWMAQRCALNKSAPKK